MVTVAVLGHRGMLGSRVVAALAPRHHVITFAHRWDARRPDDFTGAVGAARPDWVINCINGGIAELVLLPLALDGAFPGRLIQPSTDAHRENTEYGRWKSAGERGHVIRCGIVDPDGGLLAKVRDSPIFRADGKPHWNGITALAWAGVAERVIAGDLGGLIVPGSPPISIHDLAVEACYAFGWRTEVVMRVTEGPDRVQRPTLWMPPIRDQLAAYS